MRANEDTEPSEEALRRISLNCDEESVGGIIRRLIYYVTYDYQH